MLKPCLWLGPVLSGPAGLLETFYRKASLLLTYSRLAARFKGGLQRGRALSL